MPFVNSAGHTGVSKGDIDLFMTPLGHNEIPYNFVPSGILITSALLILFKQLNSNGMGLVTL